MELASVVCFVSLQQLLTSVLANPMRRWQEQTNWPQLLCSSWGRIAGVDDTWHIRHHKEKSAIFWAVVRKPPTRNSESLALSDCGGVEGKVDALATSASAVANRWLSVLEEGLQLPGTLNQSALSARPEFGVRILFCVRLTDSRLLA